MAGVSTEVFTLFAVFAAVVFLVVVFLAAVFLAAAALVTDVFPDVVFLAVPAVFSADETFVSAAFTVAAFASVVYLTSASAVFAAAVFFAPALAARLMLSLPTDTSHYLLCQRCIFFCTSAGFFVLHYRSAVVLRPFYRTVHPDKGIKHINFFQLV